MSGAPAVIGRSASAYTATDRDTAPVRVAIDVSAVPARPAGAGSYVLSMVEALDRRGGAELDLVAATGDHVRWEALAPSAAVHPVVPGTRPRRLAWEQTRGPGLVRRLGSQVWHGPHYTMPVLARVPVVVTIHDLTFFDHPEWHERTKVGYFRTMIQAAVRRATVLVCVSQHTADRLIERLHPRAPVLVIPHGVDHSHFRPDEPSPGADVDLLAGFGVRPPFVAFVGTEEPRKHIPALVRAFGRLSSRHRDLQLVLAGQKGWGTDPIDSALVANPAPDRIRRLGYVPDAVVPALLRQAEAVAYPSLDEGFGLPALETLASGGALVTTTGSAMEEVVDDAAVLVAPGDIHALTDGLAHLLAGGPEVARLRARGPEVAAAYTWARCADDHLRAYRLAVELGAETSRPRTAESDRDTDRDTDREDER